MNAFFGSFLGLIGLVFYAIVVSGIIQHSIEKNKLNGSDQPKIEQTLRNGE